jgi:flagellar protein FliO/FliZ
MRAAVRGYAVAWATLSASPALAAASGSVDYSRVMASLLFVVLLIFAARWLLRGRLGALRTGGRELLAVRAQLALGTRERIVLVQVGGEQLLLGVAPGSVRTLHVLAQPLPVDTGIAGDARVDFAERLRGVLGRDAGTP